MRSHFSHALRQVCWDGSQTFSSTVHDVVTAGTHGRTRASTSAARLRAWRLLVSWRDNQREGYAWKRGMWSCYRCVSTGEFVGFRITRCNGCNCWRSFCGDIKPLMLLIEAQTLMRLLKSSSLCFISWIANEHAFLGMTKTNKRKRLT